MNGKAAKRIRFAADCMGLKHAPTPEIRHRLMQHPVLGHVLSFSSGSAKACERTRTITRLKREYRAKPYHQRATVFIDSHRDILLGKKHGGYLPK